MDEFASVPERTGIVAACIESVNEWEHGCGSAYTRSLSGSAVTFSPWVLYGKWSAEYKCILEREDGSVALVAGEKACFRRKLRRDVSACLMYRHVGLYNDESQLHVRKRTFSVKERSACCAGDGNDYS